jgi:hypothetical protein
MNTKGRITTAALTGVATVAMILALFGSPVSAQASTGFGTQVKLGDVDFRPTAVGAQTVIAFQDTAAERIVMIDFGITGDVNDNCIYYHPSAAGTTVVNFDIRLTPCQGKAAGTFVGDTDTVEKATAFVTYAATTDSAARFGDVNNNGRLDSGDCVFFVMRTEAGVTTTPPNIVASTGNNDWTIRLTPCGAKAAGTLVFASDSDFTSYGTATTLLAIATSGVAFFDADNSAGLTTGDNVYFVPVAVAAGGLFPQFSVRLVGTAGAFGSQLKLGDTDFVPTAFGANVAISGGAFGTAGRVFSIDLGITGQVTDDCYYYRHSAAATVAPVNFDVRLTPCQGKAAGTLVGDSDTVEKATTGQVSPALTVKYADVNNNGRYDSGDCVYVGTGAATVLIASTTSNPGPGVWTLRLTPCATYAAGTLVFASETDFTSYSAAVSQTGWAGFGMSFFDADNTGTITTGDLVYFATQATGAGVAFPNHAVRIVGGSGAYGSQLKLGDSDFVPRLIVTAAVGLVAGDSEQDFGVAAQVTDNCFYYNPVAPNNALANFDVRLTSCQGKAAGTMLSDSDTVEKAQASIDATAANVVYADVNNNGRYDSGDYVYLTTGAAAALAASTGNAVWSIRLTPAGSMAAGTLVFASDTDYTSYRTSVSTTGAFGAAPVVAYFDADNGATITSGDVVYVLPGALPANALVPLFSIRLSGTPTASGPTGGTPATVSPTTGSPATGSPSTGSPTTGSPSTGSPTTGMPVTSNPTTAAPTTPTSASEEPTPGFELFVLAAGVAVAALVYRRK